MFLPGSSNGSSNPITCPRTGQAKSKTRTMKERFPRVKNGSRSGLVSRVLCAAAPVPRRTRQTMTIPLGRRLPVASSGLSNASDGPPLTAFFALLRVGFTAPPVPRLSWVRSYRTISPLPVLLRAIGRIFSVALSLGSPPPAVSRHPALRSPDFPPAVTEITTGGHPGHFGNCLHTEIRAAGQLAFVFFFFGAFSSRIRLTSASACAFSSRRT